MKFSLSHNWRYQWLSRAIKFRQSGFTLLELLVALLIGSIIITVLLQLVLELLQVERRETAVDNTQRDMRRALEYIASDVREAVYVYSTPSTSAAVDSIKDALPGGANNTVLAFWRLDPIDDVSFLNCPGMPAAQRNECNVLKVRQATYSLVVYKLVENDGNPTWPGRARIVRYRLPKYQTMTATSLNSTPGYVEPVSRTNPELTFENWRATATPTGVNPVVLVDYVDEPDSSINDVSILTCPVGMMRNPVDASQSTSFFTCVQDPAGAEEGNLNQDVEIFLRGNFEPASGGGLIRALSESSGLPTLRTAVLVRGVLDKNQ
ncbi:prepilin-type N-terminal cleavage/methylation domain-containing protein [Leptolyngbya sp. PCC 6406]|uniref:prepilin-type N-terminal cleavage/methylation domain-containing protein n=1 Tax=Leptolyngbya sp. PCC 6406 TaxID=1173264 RepID=UPI0002AC70D6|nr:prepilin-type N-terminal cleavage/methylation domain-containing protein [Leptolyngbya sp. PCC 6406]